MVFTLYEKYTKLKVSSDETLVFEACEYFDTEDKKLLDSVSDELNFFKKYDDGKCQLCILGKFDPGKKRLVTRYYKRTNK